MCVNLYIYFFHVDKYRKKRRISSCTKEATFIVLQQFRAMVGAKTVTIYWGHRMIDLLAIVSYTTRKYFWWMTAKIKTTLHDHEVLLQHTLTAVIDELKTLDKLELIHYLSNDGEIKVIWIPWLVFRFTHLNAFSWIPTYMVVIWLSRWCSFYKHIFMSLLKISTSFGWSLHQIFL